VPGAGYLRFGSVARKYFETPSLRRSCLETLRVLLPVALWALQMGLLVMFLYDESPDQQRTRRMADGALSLTLKLLGLAKLAILRPIRTAILAFLQQAELLPGDAL